MTLKQCLPPVVDHRTRLLILGSLPGDRSLIEQRYYAHPANQFWPLMADVTGEALVAMEYPNRLATLLERGVGLWDVVGTARRQGSTDGAIRDACGNDIAALAARLPKLAAIAFNGGTAFKHGMCLLDAADGRWTTIALPSSSPLNTVGRATKQAAWDGLRRFVTPGPARGSADAPAGAPIEEGPYRQRISLFWSTDRPSSAPSAPPISVPPVR